MLESPVVTVVVPTFNRATSLERLLRCLVAVEPPRGGFEVIVVDDGSKDHTRSVVEATPFRYVRQPNSGAATARNLGWRLATTPLVAFTDDDTVPSPRWLVELIRPFGDPDVVGAGGDIVPLHSGRLTAFVQAERLVGHGVRKDGEVQYLVTANAAFRRSDLAAVGGFDISFPGAAGEDVDLSLRLARRGRLVKVNDAVVAHDHRATLLALLRTYQRHGTARGALAAKHGEMSATTASRDLIRPATWLERFGRYRSESGSPVSALGYLALRAVCVVAFARGFLSGSARSAVKGDVVLLNDVADVGGGQQVTLDVAEVLQELGLVPVIACPEGWLAEEARSRGIAQEEVEFRNRRMLTERMRLPRPSAALERLAELRRIRSLMRRSGARWLHTVATVPHVVGSVSRVGSPWRLVWHVNQVHPWYMALLPAPDAVLAPSRAAALPLQWRRAIRSRTSVAPNAVDLERFRPPTPQERHDVREQLAVGADDLVVFTACRLEPSKGLHHLVLACRGIDGVVLVVAGDSFGAEGSAGYVNSIESTAHGFEVDLRLLGMRTDVDRLLKGADIAALGSTWEAFGLFLAEAAACGLPALAFDTGGIPEVVEDGETGLLAPCGDVEAFAQALNHLAKSPDVRSRLGSRAAQVAAERFSGEILMRAVSSIYGDVGMGVGSGDEGIAAGSVDGG